MNNPFTLAFGKSPLLSISRPEQTQKIINAFESDVLNEPIFMITGIRGSGKTVMMNEVSKHFENKEDWVVVELNSNSDMLEGLLSKLYSNKITNLYIKEAKIDLSFWGIGVGLTAEKHMTDKETAAGEILKELKTRNKRLLILIDEAYNNEPMQVFASAFQIFIRHELPVCLLMTGLYENIDDLQNEKNLTFLHRTPKIVPKPLNNLSMANKYKECFNISMEKANKMAKLTNGYSFAFQVLGYITWECGGDYLKAIDEYQVYLEDFVYDKLWSELSSRDKEIVVGIAKSKTGKVKEIRDILNITTNEFNPYRKRLIRKGIINGEERGLIRFEIPMFDKFVLSQVED